MSVARNAVANYLGQGWVALMGLAFLPLYVQVLGAETYGLIGFFSILQIWMTVFDLGLTPTLNREMARFKAGVYSSDIIRNLLRSIEVIFIVLGCIIIFIVWLAAPWLTQFWLHIKTIPTPVVITALRLMGFVLALRWLEQLYRAALLGLGDQIWFNAVQALLASLRWAGAYGVLIGVAPTILAFFTWQAVVSALSILILVWRLYRGLPASSGPARFDWALVKQIKHFASGMFLGSILAFLLTQVDKLLVSKMMPLEQFGYYMLASAAGGGLTQLIVPMNAAILPRLTGQVTRGENDALAATYMNACIWMAAIIIPPALVMVFMPEAVVLLWTGDDTLARTIAPLLSVIALATLCNGLMNVPYMLQLAHGWPMLAVRINAVAVALLIPAMIWAVPRYGGLGAAVAFLGLNIGYILVGAQLMHRRLLPTHKGLWYRDAIGLPLGIGGGVAVILKWILAPPISRVEAAWHVILAGFVLLVALGLGLPAIRHVLYARARWLLYRP